MQSIIRVCFVHVYSGITLLLILVVRQQIINTIQLGNNRQNKTAFTKRKYMFGTKGHKTLTTFYIIKTNVV